MRQQLAAQCWVLHKAALATELSGGAKPRMEAVGALKAALACGLW